MGSNPIRATAVPVVPDPPASVGPWCINRSSRAAAAHAASSVGENRERVGGFVPHCRTWIGEKPTKAGNGALILQLSCDPRRVLAYIPLLVAQSPPHGRGHDVQPKRPCHVERVHSYTAARVADQPAQERSRGRRLHGAKGTENAEAHGHRRIADRASEGDLQVAWSKTLKGDECARARKRSGARRRSRAAP